MEVHCFAQFPTAGFIMLYSNCIVPIHKHRIGYATNGKVHIGWLVSDGNSTQIV